MPCTSQPNLTEPKKRAQQEAIKRLETLLGTGRASLVIGAAGSVAINGWTNREGVTDLCAYRALAASNSPVLRRALARAEALAGHKLDPTAVAAGVHSHDGGATWGHH